MSQIEEIISDLKSKWSIPASAKHRGKDTFFKLSCIFKDGIEDANIQNFKFIPVELIDFWRISGGAELFVDKEYGQWGLELFNPKDVISTTKAITEERSDDFYPGDFVIGKFFGDSDLLVVRCDDQSSDYGQIIVAQPIDKRIDWPVIATGFLSFFNSYVQSEGDKYWE